MSKQTEPQGQFGVRWQEVNRRDLVVIKEKIFNVASKRDTFIAKLVKRDNFINIYSTLDNPYQ